MWHCPNFWCIRINSDSCDDMVDWWHWCQWWARCLCLGSNKWAGDDDDVMVVSKWCQFLWSTSRWAGANHDYDNDGQWWQSEGTYVSHQLADGQDPGREGSPWSQEERCTIRTQEQTNIQSDKVNSITYLPWNTNLFLPLKVCLTKCPPCQKVLLTSIVCQPENREK